MDTRILQSMIAINANNISASQTFYSSYRDFQKHIRETGQHNPDLYAKYKKLAEKELRKLHILERNQRELLSELKWVQKIENYVSFSESGWDGWIE